MTHEDILNMLFSNQCQGYEDETELEVKLHCTRFIITARNLQSRATCNLPNGEKVDVCKEACYHKRNFQYEILSVVRFVGENGEEVPVVEFSKK